MCVDESLHGRARAIELRVDEAGALNGAVRLAPLHAVQPRGRSFNGANSTSSVSILRPLTSASAPPKRS